MLQVMCMVDSEDYWYLNSINEKSQSLDYYSYTYEVAGGTEGIGNTVVRLLVVEIISAKMVVGFITPNNFEQPEQLRLRFICRDNPTEDIPVECKISGEVKKSSYMGDEVEKIEYIGYTLEKFYDGNQAKFYLLDLRPQVEQQGLGG